MTQQTEQIAKNNLKRFFEILDIKEENNNGNMFSPVHISCCRVMLGIELDKIFGELKKFSNES